MTDPNPTKANRQSAVILFDRDRNLHDVVRQQAEAAPDAIAIDFDDRSMTFAELDSLSDKLAAHLAMLGVTKGDAVAVLLPRAAVTVVAKLAIVKTGAAYVPLDPSCPVPQIEQILLTCRPRFILTEKARCSQLVMRGLDASVVDLAEVLDTITAVALVERVATTVGGADTAYVMTEVGPTGQISAVPVKHSAISRVVLDQNYIKFDQGDVILQTSGNWFDAEAFEMWGALLTGCALVGMPTGAFSINRLCELVRKAGVTTMFLTTAIFNRLADGNTGNLQSLKHVIFGGEMGSAEHVGRFLKSQPGCKITNAYGSNDVGAFEKTIAVPTRRPEPRSMDSAVARGKTMGRDDIETGVGGTRAELERIEAALRADPQLQRSIAICYREGSSAKRVVVYVQPRQGGAGKDPQFIRQIMANLRSVLPAYMIPDCAVVLDDFPLDPTGHVEHEKLPVPTNASKTEGVSSAPINQTEVILTELWQAILGRSNIGLDRNFFDLGGTSLQLVHAHARLEAQLGRAIDVVSLFTYSTIRDLSRFLDGKTAGSTRAMSAAQRATLQRQTRFQFRRSAL